MTQDLSGRQAVVPTGHLNRQRRACLPR